MTCWPATPSRPIRFKVPLDGGITIVAERREPPGRLNRLPTPANENTARVRNQTPNPISTGVRGNRGYRHWRSMAQVSAIRWK